LRLPLVLLFAERMHEFLVEAAPRLGRSGVVTLIGRPKASDSLAGHDLLGHGTATAGARRARHKVGRPRWQRALDAGGPICQVDIFCGKDPRY